MGDARDKQRSSARVQRGIRVITTVANLVAGAAVVALVNPIVRFTPRELELILLLILPFTAVAVVFTAIPRERLLRTLGDFVDRHEAGDATREDRLDLFELVMNLPRTEFRNSCICWVGVSLPVVLGVYSLSETFSFFTAIVVFLAALCAGGYAQIFIYYSLKRVLEPWREATARGLEDVKERASRIHRVGLGLKFSLVVSSLIAGATFFAVSIGQTRMLRTLEGLATAGHALQLDDLLRDAGDADLTALPDLLADRPLIAHLGTTRFLLIDRASGEILHGPRDALLGGEIRAILDSGQDEGESVLFGTASDFAWRSVNEGRHLLVATTSDAKLGANLASEHAFILCIAVIAIAVGLAATSQVTRDILLSLAALREHMSHIASGDLRRVTIFESEDEIGDVARDAERMAASLRTTVAEVVAGADQVDLAAGEIASASNSMREASGGQSRGISEVSASMERILGHVDGIRDSAANLESSTDASGEAVRNLGRSGQELSESGTQLELQVQESERSFSRMYESIRVVTDTADVLSHAAEDTTAGAEEMAASLRSVNTHVAETASLSDSVFENAEEGQRKVRETIVGMDAIREDREAIGAIIHELSTHTSQIGKILEVITNVTDETSLLALNAAIISAQAGEHGRSFGVVAGEIKNLAARVLASANEIAGIVDSVQSGAHDAVLAIQRGEATVKRGEQLSQEAGAALDAITGAARESGQRMQDVVSAVREQAQAAARVVQLMQEVDAGVERIKDANREQSERTSAASESNRAVSAAATAVQAATERQAGSVAGITESIERVNDVASSIGDALTDQATAVSTVRRLMEKLNEHNSANAASNEQMAAAAEELERQAASLRASARRFTL